MKTFITTLVLAGSALLATVTSADARPRSERGYTSGYGHYDSGNYHHSRPRYRTERYVVGHDRWGRPIFATRTVRIRPRPVVRYREVVAPCPPPVRHYRGSSGVSITAVFGR